MFYSFIGLCMVCVASKTTKFISQPYGNKEYDLFHFESLDDGEYGGSKYKISISDLKASDDPNDKFGSFTVVVRDLKDLDEAPVIYESYSNCNLNPKSENFIGKVIGDKKEKLSLDVSNDEEIEHDSSMIYALLWKPDEWFTD